MGDKRTDLRSPRGSLSQEKRRRNHLAAALSFSSNSYFSTPKRNTVVWCMVSPGFSSVLGNDG
jgi:hypothetical protein